SGTFAGYLIGLLSVPSLAARRGPRASTTVGGVCGVVGTATVALAPSPWILAAGAAETLTTSPMSPWRRGMVPLLVYAVLYFAAITIYFTYASEAARSGGLGAAAAPLLFALIGVGGLIALRTGRMTPAVGTTAVAIGSI